MRNIAPVLLYAVRDMARRIQIVVPTPHEQQLRVLNTRTRGNVICWPRRSGKDELLKMLCARWTKDYTAALFPSYRNLAPFWRDVVAMLSPVIESKNDQEYTARFIGGGFLEMWSIERFGDIRGRKYHHFLVNEAGEIAQRLDMLEMFNTVIRPTLVDYKGDWYFAGTPRGMNTFKTMLDMGLDENEHRDWSTYWSQTPVNPHIDPAELEALRESMPERVYAQEMRAQFINDTFGVFRNVANVCYATPLESAQRNRTYVAGVDVARVSDFTAVSVFDVEARTEVFLDRFNGIEFTQQAARIEAISKRFDVTTFIVERNNGGEVFIEMLRARGIPVTTIHTSNQTKSRWVNDMQLAMESAAITLLGNQIGIDELNAYDSEQLPTGLVRYSAPKGMHDDTVMARLLAWQGVLDGDKRPLMPSAQAVPSVEYSAFDGSSIPERLDLRYSQRYLPAQLGYQQSRSAQQKSQHYQPARMLHRN